MRLPRTLSSGTSRRAVVVALAIASVIVPVVLSSPAAASADSWPRKHQALSAAPEPENEEFSLRIDVSAGYTVTVCLKNSMDVVARDADFMDVRTPGGDIQCKDQIPTGQHPTLTVDRKAGASVYLEFTVTAGPSHDGIDVTARTSCSFGGLVQSVRLQCDPPQEIPTLAPVPTIKAFDPAAEGGDPEAKEGVTSLLNLLLWAVTGAGVIGIMIVGMNLALQLRRGEPGFGSTSFRQLAIILGSCILAASVAPIINFLGITLP